MTRPTATPEPAARRMTRTNRRARALREAEALGIDLRDPFAELTDDSAVDVDSLIYGRPWQALI